MSPTQPLIVRRANRSDLAEIVALDAILDSSDDSSDLVETLAEEIDAIELNGSAIGIHLLTAKRGERVVGFALAMGRVGGGDNIDRSSTILLLRRLAVAPDAQRSGVGHALLEALEHEIARDPRSMLQAHIPETAIPFYVREGWSILEPDIALAWIEAPSLAVWDALRAAGMDAGSRRRMTFLRTEDPSADASTDYNRVAFKVLRPDLITEHFGFQFGRGPSSLLAAMRVIAVESISDPARFRRLPPDVSRQVLDMALIPMVGRERADQVRRGR